jgi:hypothetical protein
MLPILNHMYPEDCATDPAQAHAVRRFFRKADPFLQESATEVAAVFRPRMEIGHARGIILVHLDGDRWRIVAQQGYPHRLFWGLGWEPLWLATFARVAFRFWRKKRNAQMLPRHPLHELCRS